VRSLGSRHLWTGTSRWSGQPWNEVDGAAASEAYPETAVNGSGTVAGRRPLEDQDYFNEFVATHFAYHGELSVLLGDVANGPSSGTDACSLSGKWLSPYLASLGLQRAQPAASHDHLGGFCTLSLAYNFCATGVCLQRMLYDDGALKAALQDHLASADPAGMLGVKILHWPGSLRKPWQRCAPSARSELDAVWWRMYGAACAAAPPRAQCRITC